MKIPRTHRPALSLLPVSLIAAGLVGWTGCQSERKPITAETSKYEVADDSSDESAAPPAAASQPAAPDATEQSPASLPVEPPSPEIPTTPASEKTPDQTKPTKPSANPPTVAGANQEKPEIQKHLDDLSALQQKDPRGATREETISNLVSAQQQIVQHADKILAGDSTENSLMRAAQAKVQALSLLAQVQPDGATRLDAFVTDLKKHPNSQLVRLGRHLEFAQQMQTFANGEGGDAQKLLTEFKKVFEEQPKDASLFQLSQQVTEIYLQKGMSKEAAEVMTLVSDAFADSADPQLANASKVIREQKSIIDVELDSKFSALLEEKPNAKEEFLAALDRLLTEYTPGENTRQFLGQMLLFVETRDMDLAEQMFAKITPAFEQKAPPEAASAVKEMAANFAKRKAILGKPFVVEGNTLEGKPFDWSKYQGKVVLVDFWATWCRPCLEEIPNIRQNYEQYNAQGFEVVGVNIDENPEDVQRFFSVQKLPWATVVSADPEKQGFQNPMLEKTGAEGIPFLVLIGRDGKAVALNPRGPELGKRLAAIFGESSSSDADKGENPLRPATPAKNETPKAG